MDEGHEKLFETLEPPRDGLARLWARIERDRRGRMRLRRMQAVAATLLVAAVATWTAVAPPIAPEPLPPEFDRMRLSLGQIPGPTEVLTIPADKRHEIAVRRVPLPTDEVVFYLFARLGDD